MEQVHYRSYRHCHWRHGERWCHSGEPSVYLEFGNYRRRHHHGDHDNGDRDHGNRDHGDHHDGGKKKY
jgi:hypothetical protein